jgi:hypothetical protein
MNAQVHPFPSNLVISKALAMRFLRDLRLVREARPVTERAAQVRDSLLVSGESLARVASEIAKAEHPLIRTVVEKFIVGSPYPAFVLSGVMLGWSKRAEYFLRSGK